MVRVCMYTAGLRNVLERAISVVESIVILLYTVRTAGARVLTISLHHIAGLGGCGLTPNSTLQSCHRMLLDHAYCRFVSLPLGS